MSSHRYTRVQRPSGHPSNNSNGTPSSSSSPSPASAQFNGNPSIISTPPTHIVSATAATSIGPLGVDWGGEVGGPSGGILDPLAAFIGGSGGGSSNGGGGGFGANSTLMNTGGGGGGGGSGGFNVATLTMHSNGAVSNTHQQGGKRTTASSAAAMVSTPPELKGTKFGFAANSNFAGGGGGGHNNSARHSASSSAFHNTSSAFAFPSTPNANNAPTATNNGAQYNNMLRASPAPQAQSGGGVHHQHFSGDNILSSLVAGVGAARQGTSPTSLSAAMGGGGSGHYNTTTGGGEGNILSFFQQQQQSAAPSAISVPPNSGGGAAAAATTNVANLIAAATAANRQKAAATTSSGGGPATPPVQSHFTNTNSSNPTAMMSTNSMMMDANKSRNNAASSNAVPVPVGATPPASGPPSKVTSPTAPSKQHHNNTATAVTNTNAHQQHQQPVNAAAPTPTAASKHSTTTAAAATKNTAAPPATTAAPAVAAADHNSPHYHGHHVPSPPLQSRVLALPPQHEVFVLFPSLEAVKHHLKAYGANYNYSSGTPQQPAATSPQSLVGIADDSTPGSPMGGKASTTTVVSGASQHQFLDGFGIHKLFSTAPPPNAQGGVTAGGGNSVASTPAASPASNSGKNNKNANNNNNGNGGVGVDPQLNANGIHSGYRVSKPTRTSLKPRVILFGNFDAIPTGVCLPAKEGAGLLFCNDGADDAIASLNTDSFIDVSSAANLTSITSKSDAMAGGSGYFNVSNSNNNTNAANSVSVTAELIIYNAASIGPIRPVDPKARNIHDYLNSLRTDAVESSTRGPNVLLVGATDTGKSSLANYLINAHLKESIASQLKFKDRFFAARRKAKEDLIAEGNANPTAAAISAAAGFVNPPLAPIIQLLDVDIGQQGASLPGCVSATNHFITGKVRHQSGQSVFYGDTSLQTDRDKKNYLHSVDALVKTMDNNMSIDRWPTDTKRMGHYPLANGRIINTMGYIVDAGFEMLVELIGVCKVDVIIVAGNNSDLKFRLQDAIQKRYGPNNDNGTAASSSASSAASRYGAATFALSGCNQHVAKHFAMPTFLLYNAPDCPITPHGLRKTKRDARIHDYFKTMRCGDVTYFADGTTSANNNTTSNGAASTPSSMFYSANGSPSSANFPTVASSSSNNNFNFNANTTNNSAVPPPPNANRLLVHRVPLSRLDIRDAKTFIPITGQGFLKMGSRKLAAIPLPTYNEVGNSALSALGGKCFFPLLEPAVSDESKLVSGGNTNGSSTSSKSGTPAAPSSPNAANNSAAGVGGAAYPTLISNPKATEVDHLLQPNSRGVVAFAAMMGLTANNDGVELIFDALYVEERLRSANVLKGAVYKSNTKIGSPSSFSSYADQQQLSEAEAKAVLDDFFSVGDYSKERITLLLSQIPIPDETVQMLTTH